MVFASDLDQTLIYSRRFLEGDFREDKFNYSWIEEIEDRKISLISNDVMTRIQELCRKDLFIPVTTRTIMQYNRLSLFKNENCPRYAVVSNGGSILNYGEPDLIWHQMILDKIKTTISIETVLQQFSEIKSDDWVISENVAEDLFIYCIIKREKLPALKLAKLAQWLDENHWIMSLQGRKLYFVPKCVDKWEAVLHILRTNHISEVITAGDSLLDLRMLFSANYAVSPGHGEIYRLYNQNINKPLQLHFTKKQGICASQEIMEHVNLFFSKRHMHTEGR